jgi:hypothetical protein
MMDILFAKTHSAEYLLHKYWARKPSNVLASLIDSIIPDKNKNILDPFCGSGVFLREASKLGHNCIGFDINPVAYLLSDLTCNPPDTEKFETVVGKIIKDFELKHEKFYKTSSGDIVKYYVHEVFSACKVCNTVQSSQQVKKLNKNKNRCIKCENKISFSLRSLKETKITKINCLDNLILSSKAELLLAKKLENYNFDKLNLNYNHSFLENNRILSFKGMKTSDLFTKRNFYILSKLADHFHNIKDKKIRDAALLLLTSSVAQSSRLIAYRNNLTTGGPAWSVPGFWVPPVHLEVNPLINIKNRFRKHIKGYSQLNKIENKKVIIFNNDFLKNKKKIKEKFDLVFLDPPYGDSVPYLEFSALWNSFLKKKINYKLDISVSDRIFQNENKWKKYGNDLNIRIKKILNFLKINSCILVTFNNHDHKAWKALLKAIQENYLVCVKSTFQLPAVISSKSQFSIDGSYISDIYSLFKVDYNKEYSLDDHKIKKALLNASLIRNGKLTKSLVYRVIFLTFLNNNIHYSIIDKLDEVIDDMFEKNLNQFYLKNFKSVSNIKIVNEYKKNIEKVLKSQIKSGEINYEKFYYSVLSLSKNVGFLSVDEAFKLIKIKYNISKGIIFLEINKKK